MIQRFFRWVFVKANFKQMFREDIRMLYTDEVERYCISTNNRIARVEHRLTKLENANSNGQSEVCKTS